MIARRSLSRVLSTLSAFVALASASTVLASPVHVPTAKPTTVAAVLDSETVRLLSTYDRDGLSFREIKTAVQDATRISITAEVEVLGPGGKPRKGTVVFTATVNYAEDGAFMDYTDDACTASQMSRQAGGDACEAIAETLDESTTSVTGIIMRDGGICDPIRHMGC